MKKKILLIEDDQIFANIYRNRLKLDGFEVEVAYDAETGLEALGKFRPDALLLDLILPRLQGVDVIKRVRSEAAFQHLPVIVFTNTYLTSTMQAASKAGATRCLAKANCTPRQVVGVLQELLPANGAASPPPTPVAPEAPRPAEQPPPPPEPLAAAAVSDEQFQAEMKQMFADSLPATLSALRSHLQNLIKTEATGERVPQVQQLLRRVHSLTSNAGIVGMYRTAQMADALEALLRELHDNPQNLNASTLRTVATAIDFLGILAQQGAGGSQEAPRAEVLVVDDEAISRRAIDYALEKARLSSVSVEDPLQALRLLAERKFDLIFLDVDMPNMNGFELCTQLRLQPAHKKTPVVFVTNLTDFESRANSSVSGGNDFIAKPFMFIELAVKALLYVLRAQLDDSPKIPEPVPSLRN
jgi:DNA-binding response OmpR family regulator